MSNVLKQEMYELWIFFEKAWKNYIYSPHIIFPSKVSKKNNYFSVKMSQFLNAILYRLKKTIK